MVDHRRSPTSMRSLQRHIEKPIRFIGLDNALGAGTRCPAIRYAREARLDRRDGLLNVYALSVGSPPTGGFGKVRSVAATIALLLSTAPAFAAAGFVYNGTITSVRDGDTFLLDGLPIRLKGVAAPESREPMGRESTANLRTLVGQRVACILTGEVSYDRMVGWCSLIGADLGDMQIAAGLARRCPSFDPMHRYPESPGSTLPLPPYCTRP